MNLFTNRVFLTILTTDIIQMMAIWIRNLATMFFIMDITDGNPMAISTLNVIEYVPMFLFTFVGGIIADKYNPKKLMLLGDSLSFISFVILGFFISEGFIGAIFIAVLISAIVTQFSYPASQKYFKEYIDEDNIETAIGISQLLSSVFAIAGPFLGSFFYFKFGIDKTLIIISGLFLVSIILILTLPNTKFTKIETDNIFEDIKMTVKYIKNEKLLETFMKVFLVIAFSLGIANNLDIFVVTQRLNLPETSYQFFSGIAGIGMLVGGIIYIAISKYTSNIKILYIFMAICSVTIFLEGYSTIPIVTIVLQFVDNMIGGILSGFVMALVTKITDQEYIGKINGLMSTLMYLGVMLGTLVSGFIMRSSSIVVAYFVAGLGFLVCTIILYKSKQQGLFETTNNENTKLGEER